MTDFIMPSGAETVIHQLTLRGYEAYIVGGCVRDTQLGLVPKDWDICTSATPGQIKSVFSYTIDTGLKHGTVTVMAEDGQYEVTTFRKDGKYTDGRHPDSVEFVTSLREDLARRDFTINAMAYSNETGIIDYFGGAEDLSNGVIRCVGKPSDRFHEDALRILRALRFASRYGFRIHPDTAESVHHNANLLRHIANERIRDELCGIISGKGCAQVLLEYGDVLSVVLPEIIPCIGFEQNNRYHSYTVYEHMLRATEAYRGNDTAVNIALLIHDIGKPLCYTEDERGGHFYGHSTYSHEIAKQIVSRLKFSNKTAKAITELVRLHDTPVEPTEKSIRKWLNRNGEERLRQLLDVKEADISAHSYETQTERIAQYEAVRRLLEQMTAAKQCFSLKDLAVNGNDIMELGVEEGEAVGEILQQLLNSVIAGDLPNEKDVLIDCAQNLSEIDVDDLDKR